MKNRWMTFVSLLLVVFAGLVVAWQLLHYDRSGDGQVPESYIALSCRKLEQLAKIHDLVPRVGEYHPGVATWWNLDLVLPEGVRVFMADMTGPTNYYKLTYYYAATYYLFPREVGISLDHQTALTKDGLIGRASESDREILTSGYDVRVDFSAGETMSYKARNGILLRNPANPEWFDSVFDKGIAFVLPLLTALTGMWLFRFLFPGLSGRTPLLEQLAYGLGLGMMAVAALTLGVKLGGFHGYHLVYFATGSAARGGNLAQPQGLSGRHCRQLPENGSPPDCYRSFLRPDRWCSWFFSVSPGCRDWLTPMRSMAWMLKAKIIHLYTGSELVQWFSNSRLAHAHLDYPTLVPSLHAATFDSLGHVDEFVTKFWPTWMLLFLLAALASLIRGRKSPVLRPVFCPVWVCLLLPATQTICPDGRWNSAHDFLHGPGFCAMRASGWSKRTAPSLALGLTLLFGAAMTKFEGFIFLALVGGWLLLVPFGPARAETHHHVSGGWRHSGFWQPCRSSVCASRYPFCTSNRVGPVTPCTTRRHPFKLSVDFYDPACPVLCEF